MQTRILTITVLVLAALLIIGFTFYQYFAGINSQPKDATSVIDEPTEQFISPDNIVEEFYRWYKTTEDIVTAVATSDQYLTDRLINEVESMFSDTVELETFDPFTCSESFPDELLVRPAHTTISGAQVVVDASIGEEEISFIVELVPLGNSWQIDAVVCFEKG